jgi:hypothetical protein
MKNERKQQRLGIDIGRVIIEGDRPGGDTNFIGGGIDDVLATPAIEGAFDTIARLTEQFAGQVWLVSKCGKRMEEKTRIWLDHFRFFEVTRIPREHVRFCRERPQKRDHAAELGLTHFIDDRADVLEHLRGLVPHLFLFGPQREPAPEWARSVADWREAEEAISG